MIAQLFLFELKIHQDGTGRDGLPVSISHFLTDIPCGSVIGTLNRRAADECV